MIFQKKVSILVCHWNCNPFTPKILHGILLIIWHTIYDVSLGNVVLDQLIIPYSNHLSAQYCNDVVRRNSVVVTHRR